MKTATTAQKTTHDSIKKQETNNNAKDLCDKKPAYAHAINYIMLLLNEAYPLQFKQAYPTKEDRARAQSIWMQVLSRYSIERVKKSAEIFLKKGRKFLPNLGELVECCRYSYQELGLKPPFAAYLEAAQHCHHIHTHTWSHLAIYLAGQQITWFLIKTEPKEWIYPQFKAHYEALCEPLRDGKPVTDLEKYLPCSKDSSILTPMEQQLDQKINKLMSEQGINRQAGKKAFDEAMLLLK
ncbi:MAG: hypothetical protein HAW62_04395 [Endozoicomonadaceae bacterium]|nr:hypothetical protein [Endozoicomonadaceae bacterium]